MTLVQVISDGGARGRHDGVSWLTKDWTGADWSVGVGVSQAGGQGQSKIKTQTNANYF